MSRRRLQRGAADERGAVAIIVAASAVILMVVTAMVLDFGVLRLDRQANRLSADDAVMAALRSGDSDGRMNTSAAVCGALHVLQANNPQLNGLSDDNGVCPAAPAAKLCKKTGSDRGTEFIGSVTAGRNRYEVRIVSPYVLSGSSYPGDGAAALASDLGKSGWNGCDQVAVFITQYTKPGLGSIASSSDLVMQVRSVGRVDLGTGKQAPALLLLDQHNCGVLDLGNGGIGNAGEIKVFGTPLQGGTIHADSDAQGSCPNNTFVITGAKADGVVAYGSTDPATPMAGSITTVAGTRSDVALSRIRDSVDNVYGATGPSTLPGTHIEPTGRDIVTRGPVDSRYLEGVRSAMSEASTTTNSWATASAPAAFNVTVDNCSPTGSTPITPGSPGHNRVDQLVATDKLFVKCNSGYNSSTALNAGTVYFNGTRVSNANLPNATRVYIKGSTATNGAAMNAVDITNNDLFAIRGGSSGTTQCTNSAQGTSAKLVVFGGRLNLGGGTFRACNTSVLLASAYSGGCLPAAGFDAYVQPMSLPCPNQTASPSTAAGNGFVTNSGSAVQDWTAPNAYLGAIPLADQNTAWHDNLEDLALWSESYGGQTDWVMAGGSNMHLVGVFMTPNATPFAIKGGSCMDLTNAQYIASRFATTGGACLRMTVDPNAVVSLPAFNKWTLVR